MSESPGSVDALVQFRQVTFAYPGAVSERVILDRMNLTIARGKVTALMGASGGGKTTVLRLIGGQQRSSAGQVLFDGQDIALMNGAGLYAMRRRMGMLFQFGALFTDLSVFDNVAFPLREHTRLSPALIRDIVLMKLDAVGLRGARDLMPAQISGGMARRVALARAIALDPELIMYDEPFAGLDPISLGTAAQLIRQLNDTLGITTVVVSHDLEETFRIADRVVILANGAIAAEVAAQRYGLEVIERNIGDRNGAVTRFVIVSKLGSIPAPTGHDRTSLAIFIAADHSGALLEILTEFAVRGVNLTFIQSRPTGSELGQYHFIVDAEGHIHDERVGDALKALYRICSEVRFLGSYPRADKVQPTSTKGMTDDAFKSAEQWLNQVRGGKRA